MQVLSAVFGSPSTERSAPLSLVRSVDATGARPGRLKPTEERLLEKPDAVAALQRLGVDLYAALEYGALVTRQGPCHGLLPSASKV